MAVFDPGKHSSDDATTFKSLWGGGVSISHTNESGYP